jgi:hypothetical protein
MNCPVVIGCALSLSVFMLGCGKAEDTRLARHDETPNSAQELPADLARKIEELKTSPYYKRVKSLEQSVVGRAVVTTEAGTSGFILELDNGTWVMAYLEKANLSGRWETANAIGRTKNCLTLHFLATHPPRSKKMFPTLTTHATFQSRLPMLGEEKSPDCRTAIGVSISVSLKDAN